MSEKPNRFALLDPTVESESNQVSLAVRPIDLYGKTIGLLANGKRNSVELLDSIYYGLNEIYKFKKVVRLNKGDISRPAPQPIIEELLANCDLAITGIGD